MKVKLHKTKKSELVSRLTAIGIFSTVLIDKIGIKMGYTSAKRRVREIAEEGEYFRSIPNKEAKERGLVKKGMQPIRWYEVK